MFDIITDSACDLTPETAATLNIEIIPFYVSLDGEHYRKEGKEIAVPANYFPEDDPDKKPVVRWRSAAQLFYNNWLNYYVYQNTPYDLGEMQRVKHSEG